jgi:hypothetical protein
MPRRRLPKAPAIGFGQQYWQLKAGSGAASATMQKHLLSELRNP